MEATYERFYKRVFGGASESDYALPH